MALNFRSILSATHAEPDDTGRVEQFVTMIAALTGVVAVALIAMLMGLS